jgi:hypothetical protein
VVPIARIDATTSRIDARMCLSSMKFRTLIPDSDGPAEAGPYDSTATIRPL